jgi:secondary thiamine-phosphate synthase enzyme
VGTEGAGTVWPFRRRAARILPVRRACVNPHALFAGDRLYVWPTIVVFINDGEPGLHADYEKWLERLAPHEPTSQYRHNRTGEDNADAHMKRQVMGREVVVAVTGGKLDFGPWEQIFYGEFDGGRKKRALIKVIGE